jgi:hypothetical protein
MLHNFYVPQTLICNHNGFVVSSNFFLFFFNLALTKFLCSDLRKDIRYISHNLYTLRANVIMLDHACMWYTCIVYFLDQSYFKLYISYMYTFEGILYLETIDQPTCKLNSSYNALSNLIWWMEWHRVDIYVIQKSTTTNRADNEFLGKTRKTDQKGQLTLQGKITFSPIGQNPERFIFSKLSFTQDL